jgi:hypothetical protein
MRTFLLQSIETIFSDLDISTSAFDQTLATLEAATKAVTDLRAFDLTNFTNHATVQAFVGAEALIQESFKSFNVSLVIFICMFVALNISRAAQCGMGSEAVGAFRCGQQGHETYGEVERYA